MNSARRCIVSGRVQGVFFRASARNMALELDVCGYAINLPDGRVEVHAEGDAAAVAALCDWLWDGPEAAEVAHVECKAAPVEGYDDFTTG
jgi:acylphosphatase